MLPDAAQRDTRGTAAMRLTAVRYAATGINLYEFTPVGKAALPDFEPGAHVDVHLPGGLVRQYSLVNEGGSGRFVVAVKRDAKSRGGSRAMHETLRVGDVLQVGTPRNNFALHEEATHSVLIAGGIGITPVAAMVARLRKLGRHYRLHYAVRNREEAPFLDELGSEDMELHVDTEQQGRPLDVRAIVAAAPAGAHLYCCGPGPMLDAFESAAAGRAPQTIHLERFSAAPDAQPDVAGGYTVRLARKGTEFAVAPGQSLLEALRLHGVDVPTSCEQGVCGTCETRVLEGVPEHRDSLLSPAERASNRTMMVCCSGARSASLVLDL